MKEEFAQLLRAARLTKGWTQFELAVQSGVGYSAIQVYENPARTELPGFQNLAKLAAVFDWDFPLSRVDNRCFDQTAIYQPEHDLILLSS